MTILDQYLRENCTEEQSSLLISCFETLTQIGLVDVSFNIDELLSQIELFDTFEVVQKCFKIVRECQDIAFNQLEISIDNEDISVANDILLLLDQLEDSDHHAEITEIIDESENPEEALIRLFDEILFADVQPILPVLQHVSVGLIERIAEVHTNNADLIKVKETAQKQIDPRKLKLLKEMWSVKETLTLRHYVISNQINLPISKKTYLSVMQEEMRAMQRGRHKDYVACRLLEATLCLSVEWKNIKKAMNKLATELFEDPLYRAELSYEIDNVCIRNEINGSF